MKCTLRKVNEGIIATIAIIDNYSMTTNGVMVKKPLKDKYEEILASTFGLGLELVLQGLTFDENKSMLEMVGKEYPYTTTDKQLIITL
jgi:hypothetical protein